MYDALLLPNLLISDWFHHAAAILCPVAWIDVHMLAPEALRAMVGVPAPFHCKAAMLASEVLDGAGEFFHSFHITDKT